MADLSKFGVPLDGESLGMLHPKQKYRFRVKFYNFGINASIREMTQNVRTVQRPTVNAEPIPLHSYNSISYIAGKHEWDTVDIALFDDINNSVVSAVGAQIQKQMNFYEQTSSVAGINYKFSVEIDTLDGTKNDALETWRLDGCYLSTYATADGDYSSGEPNEVTLTIRYDVATQIRGPNDNGGNTVSDDPMIDIPSRTGGATTG